MVAALYWAQRLPTVRFVLPTAPVSEVMGGVPSWFDFKASTVGLLLPCLPCYCLHSNKFAAVAGSANVGQFGECAVRSDR